MKSLILAACIFVCTVGIANAQRESGNYMVGFFGTNIIGSIPKREICTWSIADTRGVLDVSRCGNDRACQS